MSLATISITMSMYVTVGITGYLFYGKDTTSDVMKNLGQHWVLMVTRVFVGIAVLCHYPINQHVARAALDDLVRTLRGEEWTEYMPFWRLAINTNVVFIVSLTIALSVRLARACYNYYYC